ncbi:MAG: winged helix-turn-helix transcriptional regulator [Candidatus Thorarchaeota archaeon]|nr:winged helix-turn-helix transcriptional regulator [Candidatus Thorarchaeota archaeon]
MSKQKRKLTDEVLLDAVTRLGGKVTATELGQILGFPDRTIRYRLNRLKEKGYLNRLWPQTLDTKLGLGEAGIYFEMTEEHRSLPREFLHCFPNFYISYATYGRYNGYFAAGGYPLTTPQIIDRMIRALKQMNIVKDAYRFNTLDFISLPPDLSKYSPTAGWTWDWKDWVKQSEKIIKAGEPTNLKFDLNPSPMDYDHKDIAIIAEMKMYGQITIREISKRVGLSETQVGVRIRRLKEADVLRGFLWIIPPTPESIVLYTIAELDDPNDPALSCFQNLPFRREIFIDSPDKVNVRLVMNSSDIVGYLRAFESLRSHFRSYFIQTVVNRSIVPGGMYGFYHLHKESTGRWEMPVEEYIQNLEKFMEKH